MTGDGISSVNVWQVGVDASVKLVILAQTVLGIYDSEAVEGGIFDRCFFNSITANRK